MPLLGAIHWEAVGVTVDIAAGRLRHREAAAAVAKGPSVVWALKALDVAMPLDEQGAPVSTHVGHRGELAVLVSLQDDGLATEFGGDEKSPRSATSSAVPTNTQSLRKTRSTSAANARSR